VRYGWSDKIGEADWLDEMSRADPETLRAWGERLRYVNMPKGPKTPEEAAFYVREGVLTPEEVAVWQRHRQLMEAFLQSDPEKRLRWLIEAYRSRPRRKIRIEDTPEVRDLYSAALSLRRENPRMTWAQVAARLFIPERTLYTWRRRLG
jgi:hypothetical protein